MYVMKELMEKDKINIKQTLAKEKSSKAKVYYLIQKA